MTARPRLPRPVCTGMMPAFNRTHVTMTPKRLTFLCQRLGINPAGLARFAKSDPATVYRWLNEDLPVPHPLALLLEVMHAKGVTPEEAFRLAGIKEIPVFKAPAGRPRAVKA